LNRKYVIVVPDGAADQPLAMFSGKTIFEVAEKPNIDSISMTGRQGLCQTVPPALQPGSDVAMMAVLGYDPVKYYTGRAPIEAVAQGIDVTENDWIFRCNLVTTTDGNMVDHSSGHISSEEGKKFIDELNKELPMVMIFQISSFNHPMTILERKSSTYSRAGKMRKFSSS